jgi:hypothetical protein
VVVSELASMPICSDFSFDNSSLIGLCKFSVNKITSVYCLFHVLFCCFTYYVPKMFKKSMNSVKHVKLFMRRNPVLLWNYLNNCTLYILDIFGSKNKFKLLPENLNQESWIKIFVETCISLEILLPQSQPILNITIS